MQLSSKRVKTKKERSCPGCDIKYPAGTIMQKTAGKMNEEFQSTYWCIPCDEFLADKWKDMDNELYGTCWDWSEYKQYRENKLKDIQDGNHEESRK